MDFDEARHLVMGAAIPGEVADCILAVLDAAKTRCLELSDRLDETMENSDRMNARRASEINELRSR